MNFAQAFTPQTRSWRLQFLFLIILAQSIACGTLSDSEPTVINTPVPSATTMPTTTPTNTPVTPTETLLPTSTTTYTPTPNLTATQAILQTQAVEELIVEIRSELENYDIPSDTGHLGWASNSTTEIRTTDFDGMEYEPFAGTERFSNYVLHVNVTWDSTSGFAGCGIIFRSEGNLEQGEQYRFYTLRFEGIPAWWVHLWKYNRIIAETSGDPNLNGAINLSSDSTNEYMLVVEDALVTLYANSVRLSRVIISAQDDGRIAAFFAFQHQGTNTCTFEDAWVWVLDE